MVLLLIPVCDHAESSYLNELPAKAAVEPHLIYVRPCKDSLGPYGAQYPTVCFHVEASPGIGLVDRLCTYWKGNIYIQLSLSVALLLASGGADFKRDVRSTQAQIYGTPNSQKMS